MVKSFHAISGPHQSPNQGHKDNDPQTLYSIGSQPFAE